MSKKIVLFPEIGRVRIFLSLTRPHSRMCIRINIFSLKKRDQEDKKQKKKTKEEKRISAENLTGNDDIVLTCLLLTYLTES